jgi:hypothetical protein
MRVERVVYVEGDSARKCQKIVNDIWWQMMIRFERLYGRQPAIRFCCKPISSCMATVRSFGVYRFRIDGESL